MVIGAFEVRLKVLGARSLKEKRKVLKSLKDRFSRMNISIAEVDDQDKWQAATIGIALVSNDAGYVNSVIDKIDKSLGELPGVEVIHTKVEIMHV
ncbi:MAG TPA: DUF503 domain-containing protein [Deltaproteobacteria bacterium]|nr:DUF503 domain-containing protein [Deltaproteobacteria bacterium]HPJ93899.1 DUF503 domain-containing protein [Deltaproteobacteria bacterium]HPR50643.1 DUF503 domain-containing protein [Deltaproteobacteria bacterium]